MDKKDKNDPFVRNALWLIYNKKCFYRKEPIEINNFQVDHIIPDSMDIEEAIKFYGLPEDFEKDSYYNFVPTCFPCNNLKRAKKFDKETILYDLNIARSNVPALEKVEKKFREMDAKSIVDSGVKMALENIDFVDINATVSIHEKIITDPEKLRELIDEIDIQNIERRIKASILYFKIDNVNQMLDQFKEIYTLKRKDVHHLQAILAIVMGSNTFETDIVSLINFCYEGIQLSTELNSEKYLKIFNFLLTYYITFDLIVKKHIPNIFKRLETSKHPENADDFVTYIWESENIILTNHIKENGKIMLEIINEFLETKDIYEFHILNLHLIQLDVMINSTLINFVEKSIITEILEKNESFINLILELSNKLNIVDTKLQTHLIVGSYYDLYKKEQAELIYRRGLELAKEANHQYYINKFNVCLTTIGDNREPFNIEDTKNMPLTSIIETIRFFRLTNLDSIRDEHIKNAMKLALEDLNPIPYLKKCKYLLIGYYPSIVGQAEGLYSLGTKKISCLKKKIIHFGGSIKYLYESYKRNFCDSCNEKESRTQDYNPPSSIIDQMVYKIYEIEEEAKEK